jgi:hypothetical protein
MRTWACLLVLSVARPTLGAEKLSFDFRGARFNPDYFRYDGPTPDKYLKLEAEGLRLRYTGADVPPTNNPSGVTWRYHVRGNFVVTTRYEILKCDPPTKGTFSTGAELYVRLDNANADAVMVARGVNPNGSAVMVFKRLTKDAAGKRVTKDYHQLNTTARSLRGRLRLARTGPILTGSFAEGDDSEFTEVHRSEIGTADIRLIRMAGTAGGDAQAVLDMRILELQLEAEALSLDGPFAAPPPKPDSSRPRADPPKATSEDLARPTTGPTPTSNPNPLLLAVTLSAFVLAVLVVVGIVFLSRRRRSATVVANRPPEQNGAGNEDR